MENTEINLHTHTALCKHADGMVPDYCRSAIREGLKVLGFSEHSPFPDDRLGRYRMAYRELLPYREAVEAAKQEFPELTILAGLEVDVDEEFPMSFYEKEFKEGLRLDYMCAGAHFVQDGKGNYIHASVNAHHPPEVVKLFTDKTIRLMESGLFDFITHPDMFTGSVDAYTPEVEKCLRELIEASLRTGVLLEINAYGYRKSPVTYDDGTVRQPYPWDPFWRLAAEYDAPCVVFADSHKVEDVRGNIPQMLEYAKNMGVSCRNAALGEKILRRCRGEK